MKDLNTCPDAALLEQKERMQVALQTAGICVFGVDLCNQQYTFFENPEIIYGKSETAILNELEKFRSLPPEEYQHAVSDYFAHPEDHSAIAEAFAQILAGKSATYCARMKAGDTKYVWCKVDVNPILQNGTPTRMIGVVSDIDTIMRQSELYRSLAEHDPLTGFLTRQKTAKRITAILSKKKANTHALLIVDLDNFKSINDTRGHQYGDRVIRKTAELLQQTFPKNTIFGRWGGDEFLLFLSAIPSKHSLEQTVQRLLHTTSEHKFSLSIGISLSPENGTVLDKLFEKADEALYQAKAIKNTYHFCTSGD